jgi:ABC-2 type transport system ATP-binding protein
MTADALSFSGVTHKYGQRAALSSVTVTVRSGEMFGLIGPDGAGKTTAIRLACGLLRPDAGQVRVFGQDPATDHRAITALVGYLSQRFSLYGDLTIDENIAFQAEIHGVRGYAGERDRLLAMTQLTPFRGRRADRLSGGMKQKLALACTLIHRPKLLLLDEPTTGVDPVSRREFWKLLSEFLAAGLTIVMATPYLDEAERCGRVALLHEGAVMALDEPATLQSALPGIMLEVSAEDARPPIEALSRLPGVDDVQLFGDRAHVRLSSDKGEAVGRVAAGLKDAGITGATVRAVPPSLEDVFIHLVTRAGNAGDGQPVHGA